MIEVMALLIPFAGISLGAFGVWTHHQQKMAKREVELAAAQSGVNSAGYRKLEERVAVLERIITDQGYSLASEIENLRSLPEPGSDLAKKNRREHEPV